MSCKDEIIRALFLTFGMTEIISNTTYLVKREGLRAARKQHGELPENLPDSNIRIKVICMLISGIAFFFIALLSYVLHKNLHQYISVIAGLFAIYGCTEALYYHYWKTTGFAIVSILLLMLTVINV